MTVASAAIFSEFTIASLEARHAERVLPVLEREALPGEVEAALRVVEREQDDDRDRQQQVDQRERRVEVQRLVQQPAPERERARVAHGAHLGAA